MGAAIHQAMPSSPASTARNWTWRMRPIVLVAGVVVFVAAAYAWYGLKVRDQFFPKNFAVVESGEIYRSGQLHRRLVGRTLQKHDISVVVDMSADDARDLDEAAEREAIELLHLERHVVLGLDGDGVGDIEAYAQTIEAIVRARDAGQPVLVHCMSGTQRTGGAIACYRILVEGWQREDAYREMQRYGHDPRRNTRLIPFLNENMEALAEKLVQRGVIQR